MLEGVEWVYRRLERKCIRLFHPYWSMMLMFRQPLVSNSYEMPRKHLAQRSRLCQQIPETWLLMTSCTLAMALAT